jgi:hypothetical protein
MKPLFPARTSFNGPNWVLYVWWIITIFTLGRSIAHIVLPDGGAMSIATIPLDNYPLAAQETIITMFALWGLSQLLVGLVYVVVLVRQQSWIPLISVLLILEYAVRIGLGFFKTIPTVDTAPGVIGNLPLLFIGIILFTASIWNRMPSS